MKYECFSIGLVLVLLLLDIALSVEDIANVLENTAEFTYFNYAAYFIFTGEYLLRLWSCMAAVIFADLGSLMGRINWAANGLPLIDFIVLAAYYFEQWENSQPLASGDDADDDQQSQLHGLRVLRLFRAFRAAKILKVDKGTNAVGVLLAVFQQAAKPMIATAMMACMLVVIFATVEYYIETGANDCFGSIPMSMWWAVTAMTSVGYGDCVPVTAVGKIIGTVGSIVGAGIIALPTGILSMGFQEECEKKAQHAEAMKLEEEAVEETEKLERLEQDTKYLMEELTEVSRRQHETLRSLKQMFPDKVAHVLTKEEMRELEVDHAGNEVEEENLELIRAKVENVVSQLRKATKAKAKTRVFFKNMTIATNDKPRPP